MKEFTLVIVDMQPFYSASNNPATLAAVEREVLSAMEHHFPIVILEVPYLSPRDEEGLPPTHKQIMNHLRGYDRYHVAQKLFSDGSLQVLNTCDDYNFGRKHFRVCGVQTDLCVLDTVLGLAERKPHAVIEVIQDGCNSTTGKVNWNKFRKVPNVVVLPTGN